MLILGVAHGEAIDKTLGCMRPLTSDSVVCLVSTRGTLMQFTPNQAKSVAYLWIERNRGAISRETRANDEIHGCHDSNTDHAHARRCGG